jgi:hypothetical protein
MQIHDAARRRQFPNAIASKARHLFLRDDKTAQRSTRDLDQSALDRDRRSWLIQKPSNSWYHKRRGEASYSNATFKVGLPSRQRGSSYQSNRGGGRGYLTVARGGRLVSQGPDRMARYSGVRDAMRATLGPVSLNPSLPDDQKPN